MISRVWSGRTTPVFSTVYTYLEYEHGDMEEMQTKNTTKKTHEQIRHSPTILVNSSKNVGSSIWQEKTKTRIDKQINSGVVPVADHGLGRPFD